MLAIVLGLIVIGFIVCIPIHLQERQKAETIEEMIQEDEEKIEKYLGIPQSARVFIKRHPLVPIAVIIPIMAVIGLGVVYIVEHTPGMEVYPRK